MSNLYQWPHAGPHRATTPEDTERHVSTQVFRHGARRAEDRGMALAVHAGLQMVQEPKPAPPYLPMDADGDPLAHAMADQCQQHGTEGCADTGDDQPQSSFDAVNPGLWRVVLACAAVVLVLAFFARR